jgi:two-component system chemotaxis response regulator CheB
MTAAAPMRRAAGPIRVLIVDDSASARAALSDILAGDPGIEVMGAAGDPYAAVETMKGGLPDVILLDVELPRMDGLTFLRRIMSQRPIPVVICSGHAGRGSETMMRALEAGAVDVVTKPAAAGGAAEIAESATRLRDAVRGAAGARLSNLRRRAAAAADPAPPPTPPKLTADAVLPPPPAGALDAAIARIPRTERVVAIGASTGGTEALKEVLLALPPDAPPVVIVQHMPAGFTAAFARRLDACCAVTVREAEDGDELRRGLVLLAPGDRHCALARRGQRYVASVFDGPQVSRHRPSVDVLFRSVAQAAGPNATAALLTGMGDDGAAGLVEVRRMGGFTMAQDEATSVVFGMPKEAIARGGADVVLPLERIASALIGPAPRTRPH